MEKTHWKKLVDTDWIGVYVLPNNQPITAVITYIEKKKVKVQGKMEEQVVAYFQPNKHFNKPMLVCKTNLERLQKLTGTPYVEDWKDVTVTLQCETWTAFGKTDVGLRISPIAPVVKTIEDYPDEVALITSSTTLAELQTNYTSISKEAKIILVGLKNELKLKLK